jgi:hypothetical protein
MKKSFLILSILLVLIMSACSAAPAATITAASVTTAAVTSAASTSVLNANYENAVSVAEQLILGILSLDGTGNQVTQDQATQLLSLYETWQNQTAGQGPMQNGGQDPQATPEPQATVDQSQTDSLMQQIEAVLTSDQINAIAALQITQDSATAIMQDKGISTDTGGNSQGMGPGNGQGQPGDQNGQQGGTPPQGDQSTPPADGQQPSGNPPSGGNAPSGTEQANGNAPAGQPGGRSMVQPGLVNAIIQYLANTAGVEVPTTTSQNTTGAPGGAPVALSGGAGSSSAITTVASTFTLDSETASQSGQSYSASDQDTSAVFVTHGGNLTLNNATVTTSGETSSTEYSSLYGLNAAVLVNQGASLTMSGGTVTTSGTGANGVFSSGTDSQVTLSDLTINATGDGGHAVMATLGGMMKISNVDMTTSGGSASAIATDRGSGTINVQGGSVNTSGNNSAGLYSTGAITVEGTTFSSSGAEVAVIEGANSIKLTDSSLTSTYADKWGVLIYQSMSGDAEGTEGTFNMSGGSLTLSGLNGPLFYVTNSTANILLKGVNLSVASGNLIEAAAGDWGNQGKNGGNVILTADSQTLTGNFRADAISTLQATLQNSSILTGAINAENTAKSVKLTLDASSIWNVTADSSITCLNDADGVSGTSISNINGNGHTVTYVSSSCSALNGVTYTLSGSGTLQPAQ